jgi:hypothetical protein
VIHADHRAATVFDHRRLQGAHLRAGAGCTGAALGNYQSWSPPRLCGPERVVPAGAVFLGGSSVTATGATAGLQLAAGDTLRVPTTGAESLVLYGIVASSTANVSYLFPG